MTDQEFSTPFGGDDCRDCDEYVETVKKLEARVRRLTEALEFYADMDNHEILHKDLGLGPDPHVAAALCAEVLPGEDEMIKELVEALDKIQAHHPGNGQREYWKDLSKEDLMDGLSYDGTLASEALDKYKKWVNQND